MRIQQVPTVLACAVNSQTRARQQTGPRGNIFKLYYPVHANPPARASQTILIAFNSRAWLARVAVINPQAGQEPTHAGRPGNSKLILLFIHVYGYQSTTEFQAHFIM